MRVSYFSVMPFALTLGLYLQRVLTVFFSVKFLVELDVTSTGLFSILCVWLLFLLSCVVLCCVVIPCVALPCAVLRC